MRLSIRRKLIGTLMLVGLFPLAMSLVLILAGGAAMQVSRIRTSYEDTAHACAKDISTKLIDIELDRLAFVGSAPRTLDFLRQNNPTLPPGTDAPIPNPAAHDTELDQKWPTLKTTDEPLASILNSEISQRLRDLTANDNHPRRIFITNAAGQLLAADVKTDDFFQADEKWWQVAFNHGQGALYISSVVNPTTAAAAEVDSTATEPYVEIAFPIFDTSASGKKVILGIIKDKISAAYLFDSLTNETAVAHDQTQLIDLATSTTVYTADPASPATTAAEKFFLAHKDDAHLSVFTLLTHNITAGSMHVDFDSKIFKRFDAAQLPDWAVLVSETSHEAMTPVYRVAMFIAVIGVALILILFILGIAISNREIIQPIIRLREATAAVGRGELNIRLLAEGSTDKTFRKDELGQLARDFDEMTRQLQRNVNQLARSNEAKRRFMELAGHELRTPVTYLLGVCELAQREIAELEAAATDGLPETPESIEASKKTAASARATLLKVGNKTRRLSRIIDNLLKLVTNDQFTTRLDITPIDMKALLAQVTSDARPFITERHQTLILDISNKLPILYGDSDKLEDAITNLLSNAIRFSPDNSVLRISAHPVIGDMLEILIEDSGPGFKPEELANLFQPFNTGNILHHQSGTFEYGTKGIGLGLAIVHRFIDLHGGSVKAHPILPPKDPTIPHPTGTQFQILLPITTP